MARLFIAPLLLAGLLTGTAAFADDALVDSTPDNRAASAEDDEFDFLIEGDRNAALQTESVEGDDFGMFDEEEDDFADFAVAKPKPKARPRPAPAPVAMPSVEGQAALSDNFDARVVQTIGSSVVVELPVLLAANSDDFQGEYWVVGQVFVEGEKVAETRQLVTQAGLASSGPTMGWLKLQAPVEDSNGQVEVKVSRSTDGGTEALFSRDVSYSL